jgi:UDP-glucose 4-epimerase
MRIPAPFPGAGVARRTGVSDGTPPDRLPALALGESPAMRVVVTGATGNVGTSVVAALAADDAVTEIVGLARRRPALVVPKTTWVQADVASTPLAPVFAGAAAVVHLAWLIQPSRDEATTARTNVLGSRRVFAAAAEAGVGALIHASSVGAYSPGSPGPVGESWPTGGTPTSFYARHKAAAERELDAIERLHPRLRVVRLRPGLIFKREAASGIRRLFAGPFLPSRLVRPGLLPLLPLPRGLRVQAVHAADVADAYRRAVVDATARGAYNVAAPPVLDAAVLGRVLRARVVPVPVPVVRAAASASWRLRLHPTEPGWLDLGMGVPDMDTLRIERELGWAPRWAADAALLDLLGGVRDGAGAPTPPLDPRTSGPLRLRELAGRVGATSR